MSDVQINTAKGFFDPSPEAGPSKGTIAVDMDDVLACVLNFHHFYIHKADDNPDRQISVL
jgi:hypothetical protein